MKDARSELLARLKSDRVIIRKHYEYVVRNGNENPGDEWLRDNYYLLSESAAMSLDSLRSLGRHHTAADLKRVYLFALECIKRTGGSIAGGFDGLSCEKPFSSTGLDMLSVMLRLAALRLAAEECSGLNEDGISSAVTALRSIVEIDFRSISERYSAVSEILRRDPAGMYEDMDAHTKSFYRKMCAQNGMKLGIDEVQAAELALEKARNNEGCEHIGKFINEMHNELFPRRTIGVFCLFVRTVTPVIVSMLIAVAVHSLLCFFLLLLPMVTLLRPFTDRVFQRIPFESARLPRMDYKSIPKKAFTVAAVSCVVGVPESCTGLMTHLEKIYIKNADKNFRVCILADLPESKTKNASADRVCMEAMKRMTEKLNKRFDGAFMLLIRERSYIKTQDAWAGCERKRGAICDLMRLARGESAEYACMAGCYAELKRAKYILVLDGDTSLMMNTALQLVSVAEHPLNRPVTDGKQSRVVIGYGIISPRVETSVFSAGKTAFSRLISGAGGVSSYDGAARSVYQDFFGETMFCGKGLIDVDCFNGIMTDAFEHERVLSHDILEGGLLRCGFASDIIVTDSCPSGFSSWLKRQHRWIRGDWQNIPWIFRKHKDKIGKAVPVFNPITRYFIFDNVLREAAEISIIHLFAAAALSNTAPAIYAITALLTPVSGYLLGCVTQLVYGGIRMITGKYYSRVMPGSLAELFRAAFFMCTALTVSLNTADAAARALWRSIVSGKKLLEWTTAQQADSIRQDGVSGIIRSRVLTAVLGILLLVVSGIWPRIAGIVVLAAIPAEIITSHSLRRKDFAEVISEEALISQCADMWRYYEQFCNEENNYIPPDNYQEKPVGIIAYRTSPTNIGFMLLSAFAVRCFGFIDDTELSTRIRRALDTIDRLEKYRGNLLNWYDTRTLEPLYPRYCSAVDSGNLKACMITLRNGLSSLGKKELYFTEIERLDALINQTELAFMYNEKRRLFHIGYDLEKERLSESYYDLIMSEARLTSYIAVSDRSVPKEHWSALSRTVVSMGRYSGAVSWTGTTFEYYMPHILLPTYCGTLFYEALEFCSYCQRRAASSRKNPFGVSESCFFSFDRELNYQYKAHGTARLALKKARRDEYVVSPYSSYLMLESCPSAVIQNLTRLAKIPGMYGRYGFCEAVDFTTERTGGKPQAVKCYMAHHIGMSICSVCNYLKKDLLKRLFMAGEMGAGEELLLEKIPEGSRIYSDIDPSRDSEKPPRFERRNQNDNMICPLIPRATAYSNGDMTVVTEDIGTMRMIYRDCELLRFDADNLRSPKGIFAFADAGAETLPLQLCTDYAKSGHLSARLSERFTDFYSESNDISAGMRVALCQDVNALEIIIRVEHKQKRETPVVVSVYFEPLMTGLNSYRAHKAFSMLFAQGTVSPDGIYLFSRKRRGTEPCCALAAAVLCNGVVQHDFFRQRVLREGLTGGGLHPAFSRDSAGSNGLPDLCCFLTARLMPDSRRGCEMRLVIAAGENRGEAEATLREATAPGRKPAYVFSPFMDGSLERIIFERILPLVSMPGSLSEQKSEHIGITADIRHKLWSVGISGDSPIIICETSGERDDITVGACIRVFKRLYVMRLTFDLVVFCVSNDTYHNDRAANIYAMLDEQEASAFRSKNNGIHVIDLSSVRTDVVTAIRAFASDCVMMTGIPSKTQRVPYSPAKIYSVTPAEFEGTREGLKTAFGEFSSRNDFTVFRRPPVPWCHVLANEYFGTLLSVSSLGYTWALNSRENRLTPWYNDYVRDNNGETVFIRIGGRIYDCVPDSLCTLYPECVVYRSVASGIRVSIAVKVSGLEKTVSVELESPRDASVELMYYTEPVIGTDYRQTDCLVASRKNNRISVSNAFDEKYSGNMYIECDAANCGFCYNRADVLSGNWDGKSSNGVLAGCAAVYTRESVYSGKTSRIVFVLGWSGQAPCVPEYRRNSFKLESSDRTLDILFNTWLPIQFERCRIDARTAFSQSSGAFGFRDQLQDCCALMLLCPQKAASHILRCCERQFAQGDVLHWWHEFPEKISGVRTSCSDDMLWLCYAVSEYVRLTGDPSLLNERRGYITAPLLEPGETERYIDNAELSGRTETVFEHCIRATSRIVTGQHGLPLIGTCDWNDGFSAVGAKGRGESVWLAMFAYDVYNRMAELAPKAGNCGLAATLISKAQELKAAVMCNAEESDRFLRAFDDDGVPLGSSENREGKIDILPQAFAVLSGMFTREEARLPLKTAFEKLVDTDKGIISLFSPPMSEYNAGYISAYPSGIRENGGQYTHAAVWFAAALLEAGMAKEGKKLLDIINPIKKHLDVRSAEVYAGEPYFLAADVSSNPSCEGRAGWTIYTGAAGWYYRTVLGSLLGIRIDGNTVTVKPNLPDDFGSAEIELELNGVHLLILFIPAGDSTRGLFVGGESCESINIRCGTITAEYRY